MELLEGQTLRDLLAREAPLDPARAVSIMLQASAAVGAAHEAGLIHRDLKPANIFIEQRPNLPAVVKVLDFGVAKLVVDEQDDDYKTLTQVGAIIGTPRYMSPEQCSGAMPLTPASDVYSLGIILYEMLTGSVPFSADTPLAVALKHVSERPRRPREIVASTPAQLEAIVLHALAKNPTDRPPDGNEFRRELHAVAEDLGLEHAESTLAPSMDALRDAGTESPSGRLVIDLATLRQVQVASSGEFPPPLSKQGESAVGAGVTNRRPEFPRVNVALERGPGEKDSGRSAFKRAPLAAALVIVFIAIIGSGLLAARWWRGGVSAGGGQAANANVADAASSSPTAALSPSPSPSTSPQPIKNTGRRQEGKPRKKKSVWDKVKGIFH
jgi:serine/threonine protein kinase